MEIDYDPAKNQRNIVERGLSFERAIDLDWPDAVIRVDDRKTYPEIRLLAIGYLDNRLHILCFSPMTDGIRIISFRKANFREAKKHEKPLTLD